MAEESSLASAGLAPPQDTSDGFETVQRPRRKSVAPVAEEEAKNPFEGFETVQRQTRRLEEKPDPNIMPFLEDNDYVVATYEHLKGWKEKGEIGLGEYHERFHKWRTAVPVLGAGGDILEGGTLLYKANRLAGDDYGPDELAQRDADLKEVIAFQLDLEEMDARGMSWGSEILWGASNSLAMAGELALSGGSVTVAKAGAKEALKMGVWSALKHVTKKFGASLLTKQGLKAVAKAGTRAGLVFTPRIKAEQTRVLWDDHRISVTDKGQVLMDEARQSPATAYFKATRSIAIDALTELWGGRALKAGAGKLVAKLPDTFTRAIVGLIPENKVAQFTKSILTGKVGVYDGLLAEVGEERLAGVLNVLLGGDEREVDQFGDNLGTFEKYMNAFLLVKDEDGNWGVDGRQAGVELGIISLLGGVLGGGSFAKRKLTDKWRSKGMSDKGIEQMISSMSESEIDALNADLDLLESAITPAEDAKAGAFEIVDGKITAKGVALSEEILPDEDVPGPIDDDFDIPDYYTPEQAVIVRRYKNYINQNYDKFRANYIERIKTEYKGADNVATSDEAKFVLPGVSVENPGLFTLAHPASSAFAKKFQEELLADPKTKDLPVLVTGGGSGAGKTSGLTTFGNLDGYALIIDTTSTKMKGLREKFKTIQESGRTGAYLYIERDPVDAWTSKAGGVIQRMKKTGRPVPMHIHIDNQGSRDVARGAEAEFAKEIADGTFRFDVFTYGEPSGGAELILDKSYDKKGGPDAQRNREELREQLQVELDKWLEEGGINQEEYDALSFKDGSNSKPKSKEHGKGSKQTKVGMPEPTDRPADNLNEIDTPAKDRPYKTHNMPMRLEPPTGEVQSASAVDVMEALERVILAFGGTTPIRSGRVKGKDSLGYFSPQQSVIRIKTANNIVTASHELGHFLEEHIYADTKSWTPAVIGKTTKELKALGKELYGPKEPHNGYKSEGIAEYMRLFITDIAMAEKKAPEFHKYFTKKFLAKNKKGAKALEEVQKVAERWKQEGAVERAKQSVADTDRKAERVRLAKDKIKRIKTGLKSNWIEMLDPIRLYTLVAEKNLGKKLTDGKNPYLTASALRTTHDARTEYMVNKGMIDIKGDRVIGPPLSDITGLVEGRKNDFTVYLWAKRALALLNDPKGARNPGISKADAQQIIDELDSTAFQTASQKVYDWNDGVLNYASQASPTFAEVVKKIRARDPGNYVPLQREFRELTDMWAKKSSSANAQGGQLSKRLHGSGRRIKDIFPQMVSNARNTVKATHDRVVLDQMIALSKIPGMGYLIEKVPKDMVPSHVAEVNDVIDMLEKEGFEVSHREGEDASDIVGETLTFFMPAQTPKGKDPVMPIYNEGKVEWFYLDKQLFEAMDSMEIYRLPKIADMIFGATSRMFRTGTTGVSAGFSLISNPLRDLPTLYVNSQVHNNPAQLFATWFKSMAQAGLRGVSGESNPMFDLYTRLGGEMAQPLGQDIQHTKRSARRLFQGKFSRAIDVRNWYDFIRDTLQFPESASRVTELKGMMDEMGLKPGDPMTFSQSIKLLNAVKQVTTDFTSAGKYSRMINQVAPFFNAGIQGPRANVRAMLRNPTVFALKGLTLTASTLALWYANRDEEWYQEMPYNERFAYWYIPFELEGRKEMVRVPRPFEVGQVFGSIPEAIMDSWYRKDPESALEAVRFFITSSVPNPANSPVIEETLEQFKNRDFFFDSPIVSQSLIKKPEDEQYNEFTSNVAIFLGDMFNVSPNRIDHAIGGLGGSVAGDLVDFLGTGGVELNKEKELADMHIVGRLFKRGGAQGSRQRSIEKMYELMGEATLLQNSGKRKETRKQAKSRAMLSDAVRAVSAMLYVRGRTKSVADRDNLTSEALDIAQEVVELYNDEATGRRFKGKAKRAKKLKERTKKEVLEDSE